MSSRQIRERRDSDAEQKVNQFEGNGDVGMRMSSHRAANSHIPNLAHLPTVRSDAVLQDASGNFYYTPGYTNPLAGEAFGPGLGLPLSDPE